MGKSALAVSMLVDQYKGRPLFTNIKGLTLDHSKLPLLEEWTVEEKNDQGTSEFHFTFPPGAIVVIDECQQFFRPRANGSKVPPYVSAFETHRHKGLDFILITQGSGLVDSNIKKLVKGGLHIFLKSSYIGRYRYEKSEVINEDDKSSYSLAAKRKYKLPTHVYPLYKSAELHTKPPRAKLPLAAYALVGAVAIGGYLAYQTTVRISGAVNQTDSENEAGAMGGPEARQSAPGLMPSTPARTVPPVPFRLVDAMKPADEHNPLSAPLYADSVPPVVAPAIQGCIASRSKCACFSQQATPVHVPEAQCRDRASGLYFDPYQHQVVETQQPQALPSLPASEPGKVS